MKQLFFIIISGFILCNSMLGQSYIPTKESVPNISIYKARFLLEDALKKCEDHIYCSKTRAGTKWSDAFQLQSIAAPQITEKEAVLEYKTIGYMEPASKRGKRKYTIVFSKIEIPELEFGERKGSQFGLDIATEKWEKFWVLGASYENAKQLADALYILKNKDQKAEDQKELELFKPIAEKYKALATKPQLNESARKYVVQAQNAAEEKRYMDGIDLLEKALAVDPAFPQTHFNRAILWELAGAYGGAILEMKKYLMLVPNADDARAAQDKIYEWEGKLAK